MWILLWKGNSYLADFISTKISWLKFPVRRFVISVVSTFGYTYLAIYLAVHAYKFFFGYNFGNSAMTSMFSIVITLIISLFMHGRAFLMHWRQSAIDAERLQKENMAARFESLKSQVDPHFLFNSLNALTNLVYEDQDKAAKFIKQLSEVYRYVLDSRDKEIVLLEEEQRFLESYLFLQQIRFGDNLRLTVRLNGVKSMVAPLVLQMLIENAIKHNIVSEENPLTITLYTDDQYIVVENTLQEKTVLREESPGIGLENICKRYEFLSDKKVEVIRNTKFIVKLPVIPVES
jgi:LytS/YehU family sensor histidine kinase